jgi:hypothetical protein
VPPGGRARAGRGRCGPSQLTRLGLVDRREHAVTRSGPRMCPTSPRTSPATPACLVATPASPACQPATHACRAACPAAFPGWPRGPTSIRGRAIYLAHSRVRTFSPASGGTTTTPAATPGRTLAHPPRLALAAGWAGHQLACPYPSLCLGVRQVKPHCPPGKPAVPTLVWGPLVKGG